MIMVCVYMYGKVLCTKMETGYVAGFFHVKTLIKVGLRFLFYIFYGEGKLGKDSQLIHLEGRTEDLWGIEYRHRPIFGRVWFGLLAMHFQPFHVIPPT